jgi:hypothetical protein
MGKATRLHLWHLIWFEQPNWDLEALNCTGLQMSIMVIRGLLSPLLTPNMERGEVLMQNAAQMMAANTNFCLLIFYLFIKIVF